MGNASNRLSHISILPTSSFWRIHMLGEVIISVTDREWDLFLYPHASSPIKNGVKRGMMEKIKK